MIKDLEKTSNGKMHKIQINRISRWGIDRYGNPIKETTQMFNIRTDTVDEAVDLYKELLKKFYADYKNKSEVKKEDLK